jgi:dihydroorotate dehydrogenase
VSLYRFIRPLIFQLDPERAHHVTIDACRRLGDVPAARAFAQQRWGSPADSRLVSTVAGITFPNPVGLGAGYDKSAEGLAFLSRMGFGFLEAGSVSRWPSAGNPVRPRVFRLPADEAVIVNYGVPNDGAEIVAGRLENARSCVPIGVNIVETNTGQTAEPHEIIAELAAAAKLVAPFASFLSISAECANAPGMHPMARIENLQRLLEAIAATGALPPVFLKLRVPAENIADVLRITDPFPFVRGFRVNTISPRPYAGLHTPQERWEKMKGSLSSPVLGFPAMLQAVRAWYVRADPQRYALIASGGIRTGEDAYTALGAGASLVQAVTALIFQGPSLASRINRELLALLTERSIANVGDIIGTTSRSGAGSLSR